MYLEFHGLIRFYIKYIFLRHFVYDYNLYQRVLSASNWIRYIQYMLCNELLLSMFSQYMKFIHEFLGNF